MDLDKKGPVFGGKRLVGNNESPKDSDQRREIFSKLNSIYTNVSNPASFKGVNALYQAARPIRGVTRKIVKEFLSSQGSYTRFHRRLLKFKCRRIFSFGFNQIWGADLAIMDTLARYNDGIKYILLCIDILSGKIMVQPCKRKTGAVVAEAFQQILSREHPNKPEKFQTDYGTEFYNADFFGVLKKYNIHIYSIKSPLKMANAERAIKTLKNKLFRYMAHNDTFRYIDELQNIVTGLNNSVSTVTGLIPAKCNKENEKLYFKKRYKNSLNKLKKDFTFKLYDTVRMALPKMVFGKGFKPLYSQELFEIGKRFRTYPHTYKLFRYGEPKPRQLIEERVYSKQLVRVSRPELQKIIKNVPVRKRKI